MTIRTEPPLYGWQIWVELAGGQLMHLCTCLTGTATAAIVEALTNVDRPQYARIEVRAEMDFRLVA